MKKTNAMRILDSLAIKYEVQEYDINKEHTIERGVALRTSEKLHLTPQECFKTLAFISSDKRIFILCIPSLSEVNLKKARVACAVDKIDILKEAELLKVTGYIRGGVSPIGMRRKYPTYIDLSVKKLKKVYVSSGTLGEQLCLNPQDLIRVCEAKVCDLVYNIDTGSISHSV